VKHRHQHAFSATAQLATVSSRHGYPAPGGSATLAGPLTQTPGGAGTEVDHITITGQTTPGVFTSKAKGVDYLTDGSERFTITMTITPEPDGSLALSGHGAITGGTARYRGISGHFTFRGGAPTAGGTVTYHAVGSFVLPW
jgi:hypothetical protein